MITFRYTKYFYGGVLFRNFVTEKPYFKVTISAEPEKVTVGSDFTRNPYLTHGGWHEVYVRKFNTSIVRSVLAEISRTSVQNIEIVEIIEAHQDVSAYVYGGE